MVRKVVVGAGIAWAVVVIVAFAVLYGIGALGYTRLGVVEFSPAKVTEEYRWNGETIGITDNLKKMRRVRCEVVPERGEERTVTTPLSNKSWAVKTVEPWFSGSATMRCDDVTNIRTGFSLSMYELTTSRLFQIGMAVLAALPVGLALVWSLGLVQLRR